MLFWSAFWRSSYHGAISRNRVLSLYWMRFVQIWISNFGNPKSLTSLVGAVFQLALGLYTFWLSFLVFFCVIYDSTRQLETIRAPSMKLSKHLVWNIDQCAWELFSVPGLAVAPKFKWASAWLVECNIPLYLYAWTVLQTRSLKYNATENLLKRTLLWLLWAHQIIEEMEL